MNSKDFIKTLNIVTNLQEKPQFLSAFVFGSADKYVKLITEADACQSINHMFVGDTRTMIQFSSFNQLENLLKDQIKKNVRHPELNDADILFDKTGRLNELQQLYTTRTPRTLTEKDKQSIQFTIFHTENKIAAALAEGNDLAALMGMHTSLNDLMKAHFRIRGRWFVNDKWLLQELNNLDTIMAELLSSFLTQGDATKKHSTWIHMIDYILKPIGGRLPIARNNCNCQFCQDAISAVQIAQTML